MFKCQQCQKSSDRPIRVVVERKMVQHHHNGQPITSGPHGGYGSQIVREQNLCRPCAGVAEPVPIVRAELDPAPVEPAMIEPLPQPQNGSHFTDGELAVIAASK